jgi:hypothetical protein
MVVIMCQCEICVVARMTSHGMTMAFGIYFVVMIGMIKQSIKLQFPNPNGSMVKDMTNGVAL